SLIYRTPIIMMFITALALLPMALACGAGTGTITAKPTLKFNYSPPTAWTYPLKTTDELRSGQSQTESQAQNRINADIELAVMKAVQSFGYIPSGVSVKNAVTPESISLLKDATTECVVGWGYPEDAVVTRKCSSPVNTAEKGTTVPLYKKNGSMTVTSPIPLFESQWEAIAKKVKATLTSNAGVKFLNDIEVV
ncbi:hypothetical protein PENTCL1PPCAC_10965, partial [Pristionchus entomophagus]